MPLPYNFYKKATLYPEIFQAQLMRQFVMGKFVTHDENIAPYLRAQVISFDQNGSKLENSGSGAVCRSRSPDDPTKYYDIPARSGPNNPPRSLRARIVTNYIDSNTDDGDLRVYWPLLPAAGPDPVTLDFVYIFFENSDTRHGLWVSRVPGPDGEATNFAPGDGPMKKQAQAGSAGQGSNAAAFGNAPPPQKDYSTPDMTVGSKSNSSSKKNMEYK